MPLKAALRILHQKIAPWILPSILLLAFSGLTYRLGRAWFGMSKETGQWVLGIHTGSGLGAVGSTIYLSAVGGILILLIVSGLWMMFTSKFSKNPRRKAHRILAIIFFLPLLISAVTGMAFHVGDLWLPMSDATKDLLMDLHEGAWLGKTLKPFYILLLTAGTLGLGISGVRMLFRAKATSQT
jgi:predicted permease